MPATPREIAEAKVELRHEFKWLDKNDSGKLSYHEFKKSDLSKYFDDIDTDGDNRITFDEMWADYKKYYFPDAKEEDIDAEDMAEILVREKPRIRDYFNRIDKDKSGTVTMEELTEEFDHLKDVFGTIDADNDKAITFEEMWTNYKKEFFPDYTAEAEMRCCFKELDKDNSDSLTKDEIADALNKKYPGNKIPEEVELLRKNIDANESGKVSMYEFLKAWRANERSKRNSKKARKQNKSPTKSPKKSD